MKKQIEASIIISSYNRLPLLRRTLWSIAARKPSVPFEVIIVDDNSTEDILGELKNYSSQFPWKFIKFDASEFEAQTGMKKFLNNPCVTNNIGFRHSKGNYIFQQGNEVIAWEGVYDQLIADRPKEDVPFIVMSTTYDVPANYLDLMDKYGSNLSQAMVGECSQWPLQSTHYRSDVTNYISMASRSVWERLSGYDERYYGGISAEDSDFVRRARQLNNFETIISNGLSLHQYHSGRTKYYWPPPSVITKDRWEEGCAINRAIYEDWDGTFVNQQSWEYGSIGIKEVIENGY